MKFQQPEVNIKMIKKTRILLLFCSMLSCSTLFASNEIPGMVLIPDGFYKPLFKDDNGVPKIPVQSYYLDSHLVSNDDFLTFIDTHPNWSKENSKPIFNDVNYLKHINPESLIRKAQQPVVNVSWFAARAYCKSLDKRLPTTAEWEYAAAASKTQANGKNEPGYKQQILDWYAKPATVELPNVQQTPVNYWGVHGLHGVVWELVNDFNTSLVTGESRGDSQLEKALFCGAGAASSVDPGDYAAFMRYALRSSYEASYTMESLGFRCAKSISIEKL